MQRNNLTMLVATCPSPVSPCSLLLWWRPLLPRLILLLFAGSCQTTINFCSSSVSVTISSSFPCPSSPPASSLITQTHFLWPQGPSICRKKTIAPLHLSSSMESLLTQTCFKPRSHLKISTASPFDFQFPSCPMLLQTSTSLPLRLRQVYPLHPHLPSSLTHH